MLSTVRGHVELDPMGIPLPASMSTGRADAFENVLQERLVADRDAERLDPEQRPAEEATPVEEPAAPQQDEAPQEPEAARDEHSVGDDPTNVDLPDQATAQASPQQETPRRGEPVRQETAGKGADSPRPYSRPGEQVLATVLNPGASNPAAGAPALVGNAQTVTAVGATKGTGQPLTRAAGLDAQLPNAAPRSQAVAAGYKTNNAASAQLLQQARDSVFKQILLKLNDDGGEMRLRLQPPELGELDLRLTVEHGNRLHLAISAERGDMADLLRQHLDELTRSLQGAGLDVAGAHIEARGDGARRQLADESFGGASLERKEEVEGAGQPRLGGWVTAEGLDYWA